MFVHPLFEKPKTNAVPFVLAVVGSVAFHAGLPMLDKVKLPEPESRSVIDFIPMEVSPDPLAEAEDTPLPEPESDDPADPQADEPLDPPPDVPPPEEPVPELPPPDAEDPVAAEEKGVEAEPAAPPEDTASDDPAPESATEPAEAQEAQKEQTTRRDRPEREPVDIAAARRDKMSERLAYYEAKMAAIRQKRADKWRADRAAERAARDKARKDKVAKVRAGQHKRQPPPAALKKGGEPDAVWVCGAEDRGFRTNVSAERKVSDWVTLVPTILLTFPTSPNMVSYLGDVNHVKKRKRRYQKRLGKSEFILPAGPVEVELDLPRNAKAYIGRRDVRCLVGVTYTKTDLFPMSLVRVPLVLKLSNGRTRNALVDVEFYRDGTFDVSPADDDEPGDLGFKTGRLANAKLISSTIESHFYAAKTLNDMGKIIGVDVGGMMRDRRKKQSKAQSVQEKNQRMLEKMKQDAEKARAAKRARSQRKPPSSPPVGDKPPAPAADTEAKPKRRTSRRRTR